MIPQIVAFPFLLIGYYYGHGVGFGHMLAGIVIRGLIYGLIFKLLHNLTLSEAAILVGVVLLCVFLYTRRQPRRW